MVLKLIVIALGLIAAKLIWDIRKILTNELAKKNQE